VYPDGISPKGSWGGEARNVSILAGIGVNEDDCRDIPIIAKGYKKGPAERREPRVKFAGSGLTFQ
jgi:hypothetical protein